MEASRFSSTAAAGAVADTRTLLRDYASLTKPKVQSLLLLTTVTTMYVAGDPSPVGRCRAGAFRRVPR
jgi:protoheme IX farnesyltransferase